MSTYYQAATTVERDLSRRAPADALLRPGPPIIVWEEQVCGGWVVFVSREPGHLSSFKCPDRAAVEEVLERVDGLQALHSTQLKGVLTRFRYAA